jgi:hypothetical protein
MIEEKKDLTKSLDDFLGKQTQDLNKGESLIKTDKSLVERINKKVITEDGRQLLT